MASFCSVLVFAICAGLSVAKVYKPCELAQELHEIIMEKAKTTITNPDHPFAEAAVRYLEDIPLLVCIAGYQNYTTDVSYTLGDGLRRDGIFGIVPEVKQSTNSQEGSPMQEAATGDSYVDDDLTDDLWAFLAGALYIGYHRNSIAHRFYSQACISNHNARPVFCYLNKYVFGSFPVLVPKNPLLLRMMYQTPQKKTN
ncbi:hypothetical protein GE061_013985 [Apolygus lucorum]|uniref:Uncharacterized protein n=1 Tax=Apolygus lucorum TaxID=248454 RepID=A0A6A4K677_APOLU|nr:hypothetical protein GE061_013985 [Apolygus lucorum]